MRLLWLPEVLRAAGLTVHEYPGWRERGSTSWGPDAPSGTSSGGQPLRGPLLGVVCHATAGSRTSTDAGEMRVLWETGSTSAPVPISQLYLSRSGEWWVGASGRCNHVLPGDKSTTPHRGHGNYRLIGVEAQNDNRGEPWSARMLDSYQRGVAAICRHEGWAAGVVVSHAEHQSGKTDPLGVNMTTFRQRVAGFIEEDEVSAADVWKHQILNPDSGNDASAQWRLLDTEKKAGQILVQLSEVKAQLAVLAGKDPAAAVRAEFVKLAASLTDSLVAVVRETVPEANQETVEAALRSVLGELDN